MDEPGTQPTPTPPAASPSPSRPRPAKPESRPQSSRAQVLGALASTCTAAAALFGVIWFVTIGHQPAARSPQVLLVKTTDDQTEAFPPEAFDKALENGGQVTVRFEDIQLAHPELETFTPGKDGSFLTLGALVNFIASKGWHYQSIEMGGLVVFAR